MFPGAPYPKNRRPQDGFKSLLVEGVFGAVPDPLVNTGAPNGSAPGPNYMYGGLLTYEKPVKEWTGDIPIGASQDITYQSGVNLPANTVGFRLISVVPSCVVMINNYPPMTVISGDSFVGLRVDTLRIITDAAGSCILQAWGTGD